MPPPPSTAAGEHTLAGRQLHVEHVMGTVVSIDVRGSVPAEAAIGRAVALLHAADATFSTFREDSVIRRLDRDELLLADAPPEVRDVLARCAQLRRQTRGAFDVRHSGRLDPSAFVKGWAAQAAADVLTDAGVRDLCVNAGGDVIARGRPGDGARWRVGIQHPRDRGAVAAVVDATDLAVATSGAYERGAHLVDPRSGRAPGGLLSVTVTGPDLALADAYSTAAFALGPAAAEWTLTLPDGFQALIITAEDQVLSTPAFPFAQATA